MTYRRLLRGLAIASVISLCAVGDFSTPAQAAAGNVPVGIQISKDLGRADRSAEINITVRLKLSDKTAFDQAVDALYDPASPSFHHWMTAEDLAKYAPTKEQQQAVRTELERHGLTILSPDPTGFTIRAHGTIANVESAFNTALHQFEYKGNIFRANIRNAQLSGEAGNYVSTVAGLESHQVKPLYTRALDPRTKRPFSPVPLSQLSDGSGFPAGSSTTECLTAPATYTFEDGNTPPKGVYSGTVYDASGIPCVYLPQQLEAALGLDQVYAYGYNGSGQTIVLVEGYGYPNIKEDANAFFKLAGLPALNSSNFRIVYPQGKPDPNLGVLTGWDVEIALDVQSAHTIAPGADIVVVATNGQDSEDFQDSIEYVANNHLGNSVSNSYALDTDYLAGPLEQISWDEALEVATAQGISVNFATGDSGDNGLGTPLGAPGVPAVAPHATAVGGTSILNDLNNPGSTITTAWGDTLVFLEYGGEVLDPPQTGDVGLVGGGGGGESVFWKKPSWQAALPGTGRQTPDVSALADPYTGVAIVISEEGQQYIIFGVGGTSLSSPIFTGFWAIANEKAGHPLGQAARAIAALPYGGVQDVFPKTDSSPNNVKGVVTDQNGATKYTAADLFSGLLEGNKGFTSTIWELDPADYLDFGFGLDSSLTVTKGWDNATGFGTPYGLKFIDAVTAK